MLVLSEELEKVRDDLERFEEKLKEIDRIRGSELDLQGIFDFNA